MRALKASVKRSGARVKRAVRLPGSPANATAKVVSRTVKESEVQRNVLAWLHLNRIPAWRINQSGVPIWKKGPRGSTFAGMRPGPSTGVADILACLPPDGRFLAVECKREKGNKLSEAQEMFLNKVRAANGVAGMVRSADEAALLIKYATVGR